MRPPNNSSLVPRVPRFVPYSVTLLMLMIMHYENEIPNSLQFLCLKMFAYIFTLFAGLVPGSVDMLLASISKLVYH